MHVLSPSCRLGIVFILAIALNPLAQADHGHAPHFPASADPGAIMNAQIMNQRYQNLFFMNGPLNMNDLRPKEPVIIDEYGILPENRSKQVKGVISE